MQGFCGRWAPKGEAVRWAWNEKDSPYKDQCTPWGDSVPTTANAAPCSLQQDRTAFPDSAVLKSLTTAP